MLIVNWPNINLEMGVASILTVLVLNIFLPTLDTYTDISLVTKLYNGAEGENYNRETGWEYGHFSRPVYASVLLVPFLLNYVACWYTFYREARYKKYTFIFPLLNLYPQFGKTHYRDIWFLHINISEASRIVYTLYKDPAKGRQIKKIFEQNIGLHEVFLEAVPTTLIITVIMVEASTEKS